MRIVFRHREGGSSRPPSGARPKVWAWWQAPDGRVWRGKVSLPSHRLTTGGRVQRGQVQREIVVARGRDLGSHIWGYIRWQQEHGTSPLWQGMSPNWCVRLRSSVGQGQQELKGCEWEEAPTPSVVFLLLGFRARHWPSITNTHIHTYPYPDIRISTYALS